VNFSYFVVFSSNRFVIAFIYFSLPAYSTSATSSFIHALVSYKLLRFYYTHSDQKLFIFNLNFIK
jgi:hypothetical protein